MDNEILLPIELDGELTKEDIDILRADRIALAAMIQMILDNRRLAWLIVDAWTRIHGYQLVKKS